MTNITRVHINDFPAVLSLFRAVRDQLNRQRNDQWKWLYPNRFIYKADIRNGAMYGIKDGSRYTAVITLDASLSKAYSGLPWLDAAGKPCSLHRLAVHPDCRGQGLGKRMLFFAENLAVEAGYTSIRLDVYPESLEAVSLYSKHGYVRVGEVRYPLRKHAFIVMEKILQPLKQR